MAMSRMVMKQELTNLRMYGSKEQSVEMRLNPYGWFPRMSKTCCYESPYIKYV